MQSEASGGFTTELDPQSKQAIIDVTVKVGGKGFHGAKKVDPCEAPFCEPEKHIALAIEQLISRILNDTLPEANERQ
jgi:hypothetical protein